MMKTNLEQIKEKHSLRVNADCEVIFQREDYDIAITAQGNVYGSPDEPELNFIEFIAHHSNKKFGFKKGKDIGALMTAQERQDAEEKLLLSYFRG